ncbi:MBOAT family protein [Ruminococcaceae bacterium OttesenSCG-928-D13]|nr:MBOAT family protein [Ruminococcaceae bacterium OttesenSCG-928-D13]
MLFSTILFLFRFLPITLLLYYLSPPKMKNTTLFLCSLVFYCWGEVRFFGIMAAVILINYICGILISRFAANPALKRLFLILSIAGSLGMLLYFKYSNFFIENINTLFGASIPLIQNLVLPLGISFYTFQSMSYTIDVYWNRVPSEKNIVNFGAYVVMFPQLIAGPIVRYSEINERLHIYKNRVTLDRVEEGIMQFTFGLAKKVLVADGVNRLWTDIIGQYKGGSLSQAGIGLENVSTPLAWLGMLAYTLYIYYDFSGYSLMGIGMGKMLGFDFHMNFNLPYISKSITEFWRRWHISLSSWFKEYVYIPLGGNRKGLPRQFLNIFIVWFLTGFWHGANWNFIFWGLYYCFFLILEKTFMLKVLEKGKGWQHLYTMLIVIVGWALFVGSDPGVSLPVLLNKMFVPQGGVSALYLLRNYAGILAVGIFFSTSIPEKLYNKVKHLTWVRIVIMLGLLAICITYMVAGGYSPFLYFRF